jgi:hypothetical protein
MTRGTVEPLSLVDDEMVGSVDLDGLDVTAKLAHERGASTHDTRPTPEVVEDLVDGVLVHDVEEVLPVDDVTERASDEIEVGRGWLVRCVGMAGFPSGGLARRWGVVVGLASWATTT